MGGENVGGVEGKKMQKLTAAAMDDKCAERLLDAVKLMAICDYLDGAGKPDDVNRWTAVLYFYESPFFRSRYSADEMIALCDKAAAKGIRGRDVKKRPRLTLAQYREVMELARAGVLYEEIAKRFGVKRATLVHDVQDVRRRYGIAEKLTAGRKTGVSPKKEKTGNVVND